MGWPHPTDRLAARSANGFKAGDVLCLGEGVQEERPAESRLPVAAGREDAVPGSPHRPHGIVGTCEGRSIDRACLRNESDVEPRGRNRIGTPRGPSGGDYLVPYKGPVRREMA